MRVLVVSDVHGNLLGLRAVLDVVGRWDELVVLGDLVDYGPWPGETLDLVRELGARVVRGNHDHAAAYGVDCGCGERTHWLSTWTRENITLPGLSRGDLDWLARLPLKLELDLGGPLGRVVAVHAAPGNPLYAYLYPWLGKREVCGLLSGRRGLRLNPRPGAEAGSPGCPRGFYLVGHTHHQFKLTIEGAVVVNPGSAGQPRDGVAMAGYALIDMDSGLVSLGRVGYPIERVAEALRRLGVPEPYLGALVYMLREAREPPSRRG